MGDRSTESSFRGLLGKRWHSTERLTINVYRLSLACATALGFGRRRHINGVLSPLSLSLPLLLCCRFLPLCVLNCEIGVIFDAFFVK